MSNSKEEISRIATQWFLANENKNKASRLEAKSKKDLADFVENAQGQVTFELDGKPISLSYGITEINSEKINAKKLYDLCKSLKMEDQFWSIATIAIGAASEIFPETVLAKTKDLVQTKNWAIKKDK